MADTKGCDRTTMSMRDVLLVCEPRLPETVLKHQDIMQTSEGPGAFQKCAARIQRLDRLNAGV